MFKNVLVGVDGSSNGRDAVALAKRLADRDAEITLANVRPGVLHPLHAVTPGLVREEREASVSLLEAERAATEADAQIVSVEAMAPGRGLHVQAEEQGADLLVVGSCRRGLLGRTMLGDDTRGAVNGAPCAVAIASRGYASHSAPAAKIGVAYDGFPESSAALLAARELAAGTGARVHALEVVSLPTYAFTGLVPADMAGSLEVVREKAQARMNELDNVEGTAVHGLPGQVLAQFSGEVDLLVVGSRGYGPWRRLMLGSTSQYLAHHARCCLLVLPRGAALESETGVIAETHRSEPQKAALA